MRKELVANAVTFTVVLAVGLSILLFGYMGLRPGVTYTTLSVKLAHTGQLSAGSPILLRGVRIGDVTSVEPSTSGVRISLRYPSEYRIPVDSALSIEQLSALSEPYVEFAPRSSGGPVFATGAEIPTTAVTQSRSVSDVFEALAALNRTADTGALGRIVKTAWQATSGRDDDLTTLSRAGQLLSATVLSRMPAIRSMFADTQVYSADLDWTAGAVRRLGAEFENTATVVLSAVQEVQRMVMTLDAPEPFVTTINPFLQRLRPYLDELLPALATTGGPFISIFSALNRTVPQIDVSALLSNALQIAGTDGAARVTLTLPRP
ncbi:MlaD family protein [Tsukamurella paurometabola]|uniref:MCE family protein n=1 Tax=Tsukamurella paurometabola TaxID=2061 RepID=A0ABS5NC05_TSUPA|nr:MlaD family protein [Tsukamurella paurometabola]MBS4101590.1 MCE family protein [Tsukamurella paurometabola]